MLHAVFSVLLSLPLAGDLQLAPAAVTLTGPSATQRLLVLQTNAGEVRGDVTRKAKFASSNPKVVTVDNAGQLRAVGDGEATITATHGDLKASAHVKVQNTGATV